MVPAIDISKWQGNVNEAQVPQPIVLMRASVYGKSLAFDPLCATNYKNAVAAGKAIGLYHFCGGTDPIAEADFFIRACMPLAENDVYIIDWEVQNPNPVAWVRTFRDYVHDKTGAWPLVYLNKSTRRAYDWSSVLDKSGLYIAAPSDGFETTIPGIGTYVMQQGPIINDPGVQNPVDSDMWFGTLEQFKAYGYHAPKPVTPPAPDPTPVELPTPVIPPDPPVVPAPPVVRPPVGPPIDVVLPPKQKPKINYYYTAETDLEYVENIIIRFFKWFVR